MEFCEKYTEKTMEFCEKYTEQTWNFVILQPKNHGIL